MDYRARKLIPYIPPEEYDIIATEFLEEYYPDALKKPMIVPIKNIAVNEMGLNLEEICLSEESDIYGMTIFAGGLVDYYDLEEGLYDTKEFAEKTVLIDPEAVKKTNSGCRNNTIAHECVHWYKHRYYYKMQRITMPRYAKYCRCKVDPNLDVSDDENIMESQAIGIAPRILMPKQPFIEAAEYLGISIGKNNYQSICKLSEFFDVSKQSVEIRLTECGVL